MTFNASVFNRFDVKTAMVIFGATILCTVLISLMVVMINLHATKKELFIEMESLAQMMGSKIAGSLAFDDIEYANEIIASFADNRSVAALCIYNQRGDLFAQTGMSSRCLKNKSNFDMALKSEQVIIVPIVQRDLSLGYVYLFVSDDRIADFTRKILWPSLGVLFGSLLLIVLPIASLSQKIVSRPVTQLVETTQTLLPSGSNEYYDLKAALATIEKARLRMQDIEYVKHIMAFKLQTIVSNYGLSFSSIEDELRHNYDISRCNEKMIQNPEFDRDLASYLFSVASNEINNSIEHLGELKHLLAHQEELVADKPCTRMLDQCFLQIFDEYYKDFGQHNISAIVKESSKIEVSFFYNPFKAFLLIFFSFCDYIIRDEIKATLALFCDTSLESGFILCDLELLASSDIFAEPLNLELTSLSDFKSHNASKIREEVECEHRIKSMIEKIKFYANLNARIDKNVNVALDKNVMKISFLIERVV